MSATLYVPAEVPAPAPVIFTMTPYVAQAYHHQAVYFAKNRFAFLAVDVRGRGNSDGEFHPIGQGRDSSEVASWVAAQAFCNGKVAMWGGSYAGYSQWAAIKQRPRCLATIAPVASPYRGVDSPLRNNMFAPYLMQWLTLVSGRTAQEKLFFEDREFWADQFRRWFESGRPFELLDGLVGNPSTIFREWISHPTKGPYWDSYNPSPADYASLSIPILTITGIYDSNQPGALMHYRQHMKYASEEGRARHFLVIGPWDHAGTRRPNQIVGGLKVASEGLLDLNKLHLEWYEWVMAQGQKPAFLQRNVAYYVMGAEKWRFVDRLEELTSSYKPLYLSSTENPTDIFRSGALVEQPMSLRKYDQYVYDPADVQLASLEAMVDPGSLVDQQMLHASFGRRLIYHGRPLETDLELSGFFRLSLFIAIDQPDTDFRAWIYEITLDGSSILLTKDSLRARYRESLERESLIKTEEALRYEFTSFTFVARRLKKGSRLRLVVGPVDSIYSEKNYNSGGVVTEESIEVGRHVTVKVFHDNERPSTLYLPLARRPEGEP